MKVTPETWRIIRNTLMIEGIQSVENTPDGALHTIISNGGERFEFTDDTLERLPAMQYFMKSAGLDFEKRHPETTVLNQKGKVPPRRHRVDR